MAEKSTFIKLDRNILNWRWFHEPNTLKVWIYIIVKANVKPCGFENITIKRGEFVTSYANMSKELNMSVQSVRTAINHLKSTNEVTSLSTPKYTLVSVVNYSLYQDVSTNKLTNNQQTANKQLTNDQQQYKNDKNEKKGKNIAQPSLSEISSFITEYKLNVDSEKFCKYYNDNGWLNSDGKPIDDWKAVILNWHKNEKAKPTYTSGYAGIKNLADED